MKNGRYGITSFRRQFPDNDACLNFLFSALCIRVCSCGGSYRRIRGRRQFQCSKCRIQVAPTSGTIFHKSDTYLTMWFHAIALFSNTKGDISAKTLERDLEVSYKTAWRMLALIRKSFEKRKGKIKYINGNVFQKSNMTMFQNK